MSNNDPWADGAHIIGQPDTCFDPLAKHRNSDNEWKLVGSPATKENQIKRLVDFVNAEAAKGNREVLDLLPEDESRFQVNISGTDWIAVGEQKRGGWLVRFQDNTDANPDIQIKLSGKFERDAAISASDRYIRSHISPEVEYDELSDAESAALQRLALTSRESALSQYVFRRLPITLAREYHRLEQQANRTGNLVPFLEFCGTDAVHPIVEEAISTVWTWHKQIRVTPEMQAYFQSETDGLVLSFPLLDATYASYLAAKESGLPVEEAPTINDLEHVEPSTIKKCHAKACTDAEIKKFILYDLRHTSLTRLACACKEPWTVARIAGHGSITIGQRYVHSHRMEHSAWWAEWWAYVSDSRKPVSAEAKQGKRREKTARSSQSVSPKNGAALGTKLGTVEKPVLEGLVQ